MPQALSSKKPGRSDQAPDYRHSPPQKQRKDECNCGTHGTTQRNTKMLCDGTGEQGADRKKTLENNGVDAHHAAAQAVFDA